MDCNLEFIDRDISEKFQRFFTDLSILELRFIRTLDFPIEFKKMKKTNYIRISSFKILLS